MVIPAGAARGGGVAALPHGSRYDSHILTSDREILDVYLADIIGRQWGWPHVAAYIAGPLVCLILKYVLLDSPWYCKQNTGNRCAFPIFDFWTRMINSPDQSNRNYKPHCGDVMLLTVACNTANIYVMLLKIGILS